MSLQLSICFNFLISFPCTMFILFFEIDLNNLIVLFIIYLFNSKYILPISSFSHPTILFFFLFFFVLPWIYNLYPLVSFPQFLLFRNSWSTLFSFCEGNSCYDIFQHFAFLSHVVRINFLKYNFIYSRTLNAKQNLDHCIDEIFIYNCLYICIYKSFRILTWAIYK